jgi:hypothetical protein
VYGEKYIFKQAVAWCMERNIYLNRMWRGVWSEMDIYTGCGVGFGEKYVFKQVVAGCMERNIYLNRLWRGVWREIYI